MTRTWTRARCTTPEHTLRVRSLRHTLMLGHMHLVTQVLSPVMSSTYMCVSLWVHSHSLLRSVFHHRFPLLLDRHAKLAHCREQGDNTYDVHTSLTFSLMASSKSHTPECGFGQFEGDKQKFCLSWKVTRNMSNVMAVFIDAAAFSSVDKLKLVALVQRWNSNHDVVWMLGDVLAEAEELAVCRKVGKSEFSLKFRPKLLLLFSKLKFRAKL